MSPRPEDLLRQLGDAVVPVEDPAAVEARRNRVVGRMESVLRKEVDQRRLRERNRRLAGMLLLAAGVLLAIGIGWRARGHAPVATAAPDGVRVVAAAGTVVRTHLGQAGVVAAPNVRLDPGDLVTTAPDAEARLALPSGANVEMLASTKLEVDGLGPGGALHAEEIGLGVGKVSVQVPKLGAGESFRVRTPDAQIVVHGTAFLIQVDEEVPPSTPHTKLHVSDGTVSVLYGGTETLVHAGEEWPTPPAPVPSAAAPTPPTVSSPAAPPSPASSKGRRSARATTTSTSDTSSNAPSPPIDPSTLAEQNRLLQTALDARRRGDDAGALRALDELIARFPGSPLAQEAHVERFRALDRMGDHAGASAEARRYLANYPDGFARDEAKAIVLRQAP